MEKLLFTLPTKEMIDIGQSVAEIANSYENGHFTDESLTNFLYQETLNMNESDFDNYEMAHLARQYVNEDVISSFDEAEENIKYERELEGEYNERQFT